MNVGGYNFPSTEITDYAATSDEHYRRRQGREG